MRFDWTTLLLQTVNLLVLVWLLRRFLFRPVMGIIAERRRAADALLADAEAARDAARTEAEDVAKRRQSLAAEGDQLLASAHASAEADGRNCWRRPGRKSPGRSRPPRRPWTTNASSSATRWKPRHGSWQ